MKSTTETHCIHYFTSEGKTFLKMTIWPERVEKRKKDKSIFGPYKIRGNQMVAGFHFSPLPTPSACVPPWLR